MLLKEDIWNASSTWCVGVKGAGLDAVNKDGQTAVILASEGGHLEIVEYLKSKGAS